MYMIRSILPCSTLVVALLFGGAGAVFAQVSTPMVNPEDLGLRLPLGATARRNLEETSVLVPPDLTSSSNDTPLVARVYLEVGDRFVVMLPNGALRSVHQDEVTPTDRPFEPATKKDLAAELLQQFKGFKTKSTKRYLSIYNTSDTFCESKLTILETMYPMLVSYFRRQGLEPHAPATPMVVVMFRTKQEFHRFREMPDSILAYYNTVSNRVFLYQHSKQDVDAPLIALKQSTSTIAHEGVHQILHNIGIQNRLSRWPMWISEGLPEYLSPTSMGRRRKWGGVGVPNDLRMHELGKHLGDQSFRLGTGSLIRDLLTAERLNSKEYAVAWALTHYLATKRKDEFFSYLRDVSKLEPLEDPGNDSIRFVEHFGEGFAAVERGMLKHVRSLPYTDPVANQPYFVLKAMTPRHRAALVTTSRAMKQSRQKLLKELPVTERPQARLSVQTFPNQRAAEQHMRAFLNR